MVPNSAKAATEPHEYRYEYKFLVHELSRHEVEALVGLHPAMFSEAYPLRYVNNLYLDSFDRKSYFDNLDGMRDRVKARIRWYGTLLGNIDQPVLELKIKRGLVGRKESFSLEPFDLGPQFDSSRLSKVFEASDLPRNVRFAVNALQPHLLNRYRRKYFQSADRRVRLTLDTDLHFFRVQGRNNTLMANYNDDLNTVVELKCSRAHQQRAAQIANHLPFRMTRNSKYVQGLEILT